MLVSVISGVFVYTYYNNVNGLVLVGLGVIGFVIGVLPLAMILYDKCKNSLSDYNGVIAP